MREWKKIIIEDKETFYSVSSKGEIRNDKTGTLLKGTISKNGYHMVHLRQRIDKNCSVHRLVMKAFSPCEEMDDLQINHIDGDKSNNSFDNLEWSTNADNMRHSFQMNLQPRILRRTYQYDLDGNFITEYEAAGDAAKAIDGDRTNILRCLNEEQTIYKGFQFKSFKSEKIPEWKSPSKNAVWVYLEDGTFFATYGSQSEAAMAFGVGISSMSRYVNGKRQFKDYVFSKIPL